MRHVYIGSHTTEEAMRTGALVAIAFVLLGFGLMLGLKGASASGVHGETFSCGSPWFVDTEALQRQESRDGFADALNGRAVSVADYRQRCADAFGSRGTLGSVLAGLGALVLVGVAVTRRPQTAEAPPAG
jgi:hypothetical protein